MSLDDLFRAAQAGEPHAERRLFEEIRRELDGYYRRRVAEADVDDLIQHTCEVISREMPGFVPRGKRAFRSFVFSVAHNRLLNYRRRVARQRREPEGWVVEPEPGWLELALGHERRALVREAVAAVRSTFRRALESRLEERSDREFAREEGIKTGTVRTRVKRGLELLRAELASRRLTPPTT